jgi:hypothetical protein
MQVDTTSAMVSVSPVEGVKPEAGAPEANEPEITPAMIAAGADELSTYWEDRDDPREVVVRIFQRMLRASRICERSRS